MPIVTIPIPLGNSFIADKEIYNENGITITFKKIDENYRNKFFGYNELKIDENQYSVVELNHESLPIKINRLYSYSLDRILKHNCILEVVDNKNNFEVTFELANIIKYLKLMTLIYLELL